MSIRQGLHYPKKNGSIHSHPRKECSRNHILSKKSLTIGQKLWFFKGEPSATSSFEVSKTILEFWYQTCKKPGWKSGLFHSSVGIYILSKGVPSSTISWSKSVSVVSGGLETASCLKNTRFSAATLIIPQHYDRNKTWKSGAIYLNKKLFGQFGIKGVFFFTINSLLQNIRVGVALAPFPSISKSGC